MAIVNEILVGRFNRALQKLLNMKGPANVRQIAGEIVASFPLFYGRENRYLEDWRTFGAQAGTNAVAAQDSVIRINNPVGSNAVVIIEQIFMFAGVLTTLFIDGGITQPILDLANPVTAYSFDSRFKLANTGFNSIAHVSWANNIGGLDLTPIAVVLQPNIELIFMNHEDQEIVLQPGSALQLRTNAQNLQLQGGFQWRERFLEDSERT